MEEINFLTLQLAKKYTDEHGGGGGGTSNYNDLSHRPQINSTTLEGNMSYADLGIASAMDLSSLSGDVSAIKDGQTIDSFGDVESALANKVDKVDGKGLSTNDYTDADKAIVGGVTAALADKADKSAVKNEFIGTLAQWNALTAEQKKAYDTYQITDDYTEGSGGLPDYSTTEQLTGQKWIDGKDKYFITVDVGGLPNNNVKRVSCPLNIDTLIDIRGATDKKRVLPHVYVAGGYSEFIGVSYTADDQIAISTNQDFSGENAYVTLWYTKTA